MRKKTDLKVQQLMKESKSKKNRCETAFLDLQKFLLFQQQIILERNNFISCTCKDTHNNIFDKSFFYAFTHLTQLEQAKYYYNCITTVENYVCNTKQQQLKEEQDDNNQQNIIWYTIALLKKGVIFNSQIKNQLFIDKKELNFRISTQAKYYDIKDFLIRESKKNQVESKVGHSKRFLIFENISGSGPQTIRIQFLDPKQYQLAFQAIQQVYFQAHKRYILQVLQYLSNGTSRRGYAEITLKYNNKLNENIFSEDTPSSKELQQYQYLDIVHPTSGIQIQDIEKLTFIQAIQEGHLIWGKQWQLNNKGQVKNVDYQYIAVQRNAIKKIIKSMGTKAILMGEQVNMPIQMFGRQSNLLLLAKACKYFPYFFAKNPCYQDSQSCTIDKFTKIFCSVVGFNLIRNSMGKPIEPLLGQTYQGFLDGYPISLQQIGKNCSYLLYKRQNWTLSGSLNLLAISSGINSVAAGQKGILTLQIMTPKNSKRVIHFTIPFITLSGLVLGDRYVTIKGTSVIYQQNQRIFSAINWGKGKINPDFVTISKRADFVCGQIVKLKQGKQFNMSKYLSDQNYLQEFQKSNYIQKKLGELYGNWTSQLYYDGEPLFNIDKDDPGYLYHYRYPLPSDSRQRRDIQCLAMEKISDAEREKQLAKNQMEIDKQLRSKYLKK